MCSQLFFASAWHFKKRRFPRNLSDDPVFVYEHLEISNKFVPTNCWLVEQLESCFLVFTKFNSRSTLRPASVNRFSNLLIAVIKFERSKHWMALSIKLYRGAKIAIAQSELIKFSMSLDKIGFAISLRIETTSLECIAPHLIAETNCTISSHMNKPWDFPTSPWALSPYQSLWLLRWKENNEHAHD